MEFSKKPNQPKPLHHHVLTNLQTHFSNFIHQISPKLIHNNPFCSLSSKFQNKTNNNSQLALSSAEIKKRLAGIRVYKVSNYSNDICSCKNNDNDKSIQLFYLNERDAHDFLHQVESVGINGDLGNDHLKILNTPLSQVVEYGADLPLIRLVPELSQVKSAIKETKKNMTNFSGDSFSGVPVFQSDYLQVNDTAGRIYNPVYLRKEDLESTRSAFLSPKEIKRDIIKVATLEDIIQEMKDISSSKSNDVIFVGPGMSGTWFNGEHIC